MIGSFIILLIVVLLFLCLMQKTKDSFTKWFLSIFLVIFSIVLGAKIVTLFIVNEPKAIDVYRGNTTLKVIEIVEDSIVVSRDSVVKFKNNNEHNNRYKKFIEH